MNRFERMRNILRVLQQLHNINGGAGENLAIISYFAASSRSTCHRYLKAMEGMKLVSSEQGIVKGKSATLWSITGGGKAWLDQWIELL